MRDGMRDGTCEVMGEKGGERGRIVNGRRMRGGSPRVPPLPCLPIPDRSSLRLPNSLVPTPPPTSDSSSFIHPGGDSSKQNISFSVALVVPRILIAFRVTQLHPLLCNLLVVSSSLNVHLCSRTMWVRVQVCNESTFEGSPEHL